MFYGAKSTLFGSFYVHGGLLGVLLGGIIAGYLCRRLDGMLAPETPPLIKSVAIAWLSVLWMIWASSTTWGLMAIGAMVIPALFVWIFLPKTKSERRIKMELWQTASKSVYSIRQ
jgi:hypothetical protein